MGLDLEYVAGQTPLDDDELNDLLIKTVTTRGELDEFEQKNIEEAVQWILSRSFKKEVVLTEAFITEVHYRMYGEVWAWAGKYRKTEKNIGIDQWQIGVELKKLLDDVLFWIDKETYSPDEISIRFKHRLVSIHCFPNGNGRHSRLMADILIEKIFGNTVFTWGAGDLIKQGDSREEYLRSVRAADKGDIKPLLKFARS